MIRISRNAKVTSDIWWRQIAVYALRHPNSAVDIVLGGIDANDDWTGDDITADSFLAVARTIPGWSVHVPAVLNGSNPVTHPITVERIDHDNV